MSVSELIQANITQLDVDAIVNAAKTRYLGWEVLMEPNAWLQYSTY